MLLSKPGSRLFFLTVLFIFSMPAVLKAEVNGPYYDFLSTGVAQLNRNNLDAALEQFESAIAQDNNGVEAHYYLGVVQARSNRDREAEAQFKKALSIDRTFIPARFDLGVLYFQIRKDEDAMKALQIVESVDPGRARVHYYQGLILRRNGKPKEADLKLQKAVQLDPDLATLVSFQTGISEYEAGAADSAKVKFQEVLALEPQGEFSGPAQDFIRLIESESVDKKPWKILTSFGFQYDDNVVLDPGGGAVSSGITDKDDFLGVFYLKGQYDWLKKDQWSSTIEYRFFQNVHFESNLDDFNIQDHQLILTGRRQIGVHELSLVYEFQYVSLGGDSYLKHHGIGPRFAVKHENNHYSEFVYRYGHKSFENIEPLFAGNTNRDADIHQFGANHIVLFGDKGHFFGGYQFEIEDAGNSADEDDWSYYGHRINLGLTLPSWKTLVFSFETDLVRRDYTDLNSAATPQVEREDNDFLFIGMVSRSMTEILTLSAQYLYQNNHSNVPVYDYQRSIFGVFVSAEF